MLPTSVLPAPLWHAQLGTLARAWSLAWRGEAGRAGIVAGGLHGKEGRESRCCERTLTKSRLENTSDNHFNSSPLTRVGTFSYN